MIPMCRIYTLLMLVFITSNILAQNVAFVYDDAGNRIKRLASGPSNGCDFNISLPSTASAGTNQSITLTATCSGANCGEVAYSWTGVNSSGTSYNTTFNAPSSAGTCNYKLTATKNGCTAKEANLVLTVTTDNPPVCSSPRKPENPAGTSAGLTYKYYEGASSANWCATSTLSTLSVKNRPCFQLKARPVFSILLKTII
jgi:hypothetical protein